MIAIFRYALEFLSGLAGWLREKQLIDAGKASERGKINAETIDAARVALDAKNSVDNLDDSAVSDRLRKKWRR